MEIFVFECPRQLTIDTAEELRRRIVGAGATRVAVDAGEVQRIDSAGLQVLVAAAADWRRRGVAWSWRRRSPAVEEAIELSGLAEALAAA